MQFQGVRMLPVLLQCPAVPRFRLGKLSDKDYEQTKLGLQKELAGVMAEIDKVVGGTA